ncbi:MAG TPA: hypothetical protein PLJ21_07850 [Pseudobdellovibrionaceae bacterium]|nr:hypothetical protein [Pseudobdellovibrionaceae bacterium]
MIKKYLILFLISFVFLFSQFLLAQNNNPNQVTNELLEVRNKLEKDIQENLSSLISTQLHRESFSVAARVQVQLIPPPEKKKEEKIEKEPPPAGLDLGIISAYELAESYEKQLEELKLKKDELNKQTTPSQFQITKIEILVGLNPEYGNDYFKKFESWLKTKIKKDYGSIGFAGVNALSNKKIEKKIEEPVVPKDEPFQMKYLSLILAALLLTLGLFILGMLLKSGLNRVATATKPLKIEPQGEFQIAGLNNEKPIEEPTETLPAPRPDIYTDHDQIDRLTKKIAFLVLELEKNISDLVQVWIDSGEEGFMKTSLLVDTVLTARENIMSETGNFASIPIPLTEEMAKLYEENLSESYRRIVNLPEQEKLDYLEKIYWDLVSVRTLGLKSLRRPFDFLQSISRENLNELLLNQSEQSRALAIMYLPEDIQESALNEFPDDIRENIVKNALKNSQLSDKQIWDMDTSLKVTVINQSASPTEKLVNLFPRTIEVIKSLNVLEEIRILRRVAPSLDQKGLLLKQQHNTLAFIEEWKSEYIGKLVRVSTAEELVTILHMIPEAKESVLVECNETMKMIIQDDLRLPESKDESRKVNLLESLKSKWNRIAANDNVPMSKVIKGSAVLKEMSHAA